RIGITVRRTGGEFPGGVDIMHDAAVLLGRPDSPVLFDVGANVGQTIDEFSRHFSRPRIFSFEPSPATFTVLSRKHAHHPGIRLENIALGSQPGRATFHIDPQWPVNDSLLPS